MRTQMRTVPLSPDSEGRRDTQPVASMTFQDARQRYNARLKAALRGGLVESADEDAEGPTKADIVARLKDGLKNGSITLEQLISEQDDDERRLRGYAVSPPEPGTEQAARVALMKKSVAARAVVITTEEQMALKSRYGTRQASPNIPARSWWK